MRKTDIYLCENKGADQLCSNCTADQRLCFRYTDVKFLFYSYPKFQASSLLLWLYRLIFVRPGWKSQRRVFWRRGSFQNVKACHDDGSMISASIAAEFQIPELSSLTMSAMYN